MGEESTLAYERHAESYLAVRDTSLVGANIVDRWARDLKPNATVLELACGGGYPVTAALQENDLSVWAIDSSPTLLRTFRARFPDVVTRCESVQTSTFFDRKFDAVIAVGLMFLLSESDQIDLIRRIPSALRAGGRFMFGAPAEAGRWPDITTGVESVSLGFEVYERTLTQAGFRLAQQLVDQGDSNYYDAVFDGPATPIG
ncbi:MAG: class I SAM-dependent methyltransferase [Pseudomonadota bacterium]